jgi:chromosome segregation protein
MLLSIEADLAGVLAAGVPPTAEAIGRARDRRDRAWQAIRALHVAQGPPPPDIADLPADLPGAFAGLITEADSLADRRTDEAERVAAYEQLRSSQARLRVARGAEVALLDAAEAGFQAALGAWQAAWQPAGITPGDPARMREFLARREAIARLLDDATAKQRQVARLRARRAAVLGSLCAVMPGFAGDQLAPLLQAASLRRKDMERAHQIYADALRLVGETQAARGEQARKRQALDAATEGWWAAWAPIADALGLAKDASAQAGAEALAVWADIERHARDMRAARRRVAEMTADIDAFSARVAAVCAGCAADLAGEAPGSALRALNGRLARNRSAEAERKKLLQACADRAVALASLGAQMAEAADTLAALRSLAGVEDDEALQAAIARAHQAALLDTAMEERARELRRLDDGRTLDELAQEADGEAHDTLPGRIAEIDSRRRDIAAENEGFASRLRDLETRIAAMERGHDAAEAAQRMRNAAAEAEEIAARYVRLRLSHSLLRAGIERFRRERQAPLLAAAGEVFAALTQGRYASLAVDEAEDARMVVVALRPDGTACPADRLSEGARDQLYLALRLAAISGLAEQTEPLPFIADDLLASFDDSRAQATLRVLAGFSAVTQTILFTHHGHIADMADAATTQVHRLMPG